MEYRFRCQVFLISFSLKKFSYGRDPDLSTAICRDSSKMMNLDDSNMCVKVCFQSAELFQKVMFAASKNLAIV